MTETLTPSVTFQDFALKPELLQAIETLGFAMPTEVQAQSLPILLNEEVDFIGLAQTGTGKTAAYGLPMLQRIDLDTKKPQALILTPTRELCTQVANELMKLGQCMEGLRIEAVYGGAYMMRQVDSLRRGVHVIVATPGRMIDQIKRGNAKIGELSLVILDEADKMLEMGFEEDVNTILESVKEGRRTWLFSATMPAPIRKIAAQYMEEPKEISIGLRNTAAENLSHQYYLAKPADRLEVLQRIIDLDKDIYGLIFTRTRAEAQDVAEELIKNGYNADALHGDLQQQQRERVMKMFRERTLQILVATDVAARGLDVQDVSHVIHFGLPEDVETYIHRAGRTARAGRSGVSAAITSPAERNRMEQIERLIKTKFERKVVPNAGNIVEKRLVSICDNILKAEADAEAMEPYIGLFNEKLGALSTQELIEKLCWTNVSKLLDYYQNARDLNISQQAKKEKGRNNDRNDRNDRNSRSRDDRFDRRSGGRDSYSDRNRGASSSRYQRFSVNIGANDGFNKKTFVEWVCRYTALPSNHIHRVELLGDTAYFESFSDEAYMVRRRMAEATHHNRVVAINVIEGTASEQSRSDSSYNRGSGAGGRRERRFGNDGGYGGGNRRESNNNGGGSFGGGYNSERRERSAPRNTDYSERVHDRGGERRERNDRERGDNFGGSAGFRRDGGGSRPSFNKSSAPNNQNEGRMREFGENILRKRRK